LWTAPSGTRPFVATDGGIRTVSATAVVRAEATLQVLREIITKMPDTLDRSNQFLTNVERIIRESELPALSADSRKFFSTTSAQIFLFYPELRRSRRRSHAIAMARLEAVTRTPGSWRVARPARRWTRT
jgi:hypothetical protein